MVQYLFSFSLRIIFLRSVAPAINKIKTTKNCEIVSSIVCYHWSAYFEHFCQYNISIVLSISADNIMGTSFLSPFSLFSLVSFFSFLIYILSVYFLFSLFPSKPSIFTATMESGEEEFEAEIEAHDWDGGRASAQLAQKDEELR